MKKIRIINELTGTTFSGYFDNDLKMNEWINEQIQLNSWGLPERFENNPIEGRVLETREIAQEIGSETIISTEYKIKADYVVEIIDLEQDYNYLLQKCYENRRAAYGSWEKQLDEIFHNGLESWQARIAQVKLEFPLPVKE